MNRKWIVVGAVTGIVILVIALLFILPLLSPNKLTIQFYKDGEPVGVPLSAFPLSPFRKDGIEVDGFTVTANWQTNDPTISYVEVAVYLKISYYIGLGEVIVHNAILWVATGSVGPDQVGTRTSGIFPLEPLCVNVPEDSTFLLYFYGDANFYTGNPEHGTEVLVATVQVAAVTVRLYKAPYTYTATLDIGW